MSPIGKLPNELILEVMKNHILRAPEFTFDRTLAIINISQVCGRWRSVALSHSHLWVKALSPSTPITLLREVVIPRCNHATIDSIVDPDIPDPFLNNNWNPDPFDDDDDDSLESNVPETDISNHSLNSNAQDQTSITTRLSLLGPVLNMRPKEIIIKIPTQDWKMLDALFFSRREMLQLEKLVVIRSDTDQNLFHPKSKSEGGEFTISSLDEALRLASSSWMLKSIGFQGCTTFIDSQALSMVEQLIIQKLPPGIAYEPKNLLKSLGRMTQLKVLKLMFVTLTRDYLVRTQPPDQFSLPDLGILIDLPHLQQLSLAGPIEDIRQLLCSMETPAGCCFDIFADGVQEHPSDQDRLNAIVNELEHKISPKIIPANSTSVSIQSDAKDYYMVSIFEETPEGEENIQLLRFYCQWYFDFDDDVSFVNQTVLSRLHQLHRAKYLKVNFENIDNNFFKGLVLDAILSRFQNVVVLQIFGTETYNFFLPRFKKPSHPACFPSLKKLIFRSVDFVQKPNEEDPRNLGEILTDYVRRRNSSNLLNCAKDFSVQFIDSRDRNGLTTASIRRHFFARKLLQNQ